MAAALSVSGFPGDDAHFLGFLPKARSQRLARLRDAAHSASVVVFFESPNRLGATLAEIGVLLDDPEVAVCRELTKVHEEVRRGRASELATRFTTTRGECTVVVDTRGCLPAEEQGAVPAYMAEMQRAGARRSLAAAEAARRFGVSRQFAYSFWA